MKLLALRSAPLFLCLGWVSPARSAPQTASPPRLGARQTQQMVDRVLRETSALRGLSIKRSVPGVVETRAQVEAMLRGKMKSELTSNQIAATQILLRQLGLVPAKFQLQSAYIALMGEQIAGYYDAKTKVFTTTDRVSSGELETVMAHELTHALQDQHFDLSRLEKWPEHDSDARLAMSALVEGDATLVMSRYMASNPLRFLGVLASSLRSQGASQGFTKAPRILRESLTFPYLQGLDFTTRLYRRGGWQAVSSAFGHLPQSSEQILHFEKYLAGEAPQKVELRDLSRAPSRALGRGWTLLDHDVNGEIGLFLTLAEPLGDDDAARAAVAGWAGDRYSVYRGPKKSALVVQDCRFDTVGDAQQWRDAYARSASKRLKIQAQKRGALQVWNAAPKGVWMEQKGVRVLILEGTVGAFNPALLLRELWR